MEEEEVSVSEEEEHEDLRTQPQQEDLERHRAATGMNCGYLVSSVEEAIFNRHMKLLFLIIFTWAVISLLIFEKLVKHLCPPDAFYYWDYSFNEMWLFGGVQIGQTEIVLLTVFATLLVVGVFMKKMTKSTGSAPPRKVQTFSALVQQI